MHLGSYKIPNLMPKPFLEYENFYNKRPIGHIAHLSNSAS